MKMLAKKGQEEKEEVNEINFKKRNFPFKTTGTIILGGGGAAL